MTERVFLVHSLDLALTVYHLQATGRRLQGIINSTKLTFVKSASALSSKTLCVEAAFLFMQLGIT